VMEDEGWRGGRALRQQEDSDEGGDSGFHAFGA
jgi:hypothetical protein